MLLTEEESGSARKFRRARWVPLAWVLAMVYPFAVADPSFAGFIQVDTVVDVKTRFSRGCSTLQEVAEQARARGIDAVIFGDLARDSLEYGLVPFERIIKKRNENSSVLTVGAPAYVSEINDNDKQFEEILLIHGTEVAPFYYWSGNVFKNNLVANNADKHLLVVGLEDPENYEHLPILNSNFSKRYLERYQYFFGGCVALFLLSLVPVVKGYRRKWTGTLSAVLFLLVVNNQPLRSAPYDQYGGDRGIEPYQELIDYVKSHNGLIFWNHMESPEGVRQEGRIGYKTLPHPEDLVLSHDYTGFQAVAGYPVMQIEPGNEWDHVLNEYLKGQRARPAWGYGGNNFRCADLEVKLGDIRTVILVRQKSREEVLDAMMKGRMYAVRQTGDDRLSLDDFTVSDLKTGQQATLGEELVSSDFPELKVKVRSTQGTEKSVHLSIVRDGQEVKEETASLPYELTWRDVEVKPEGSVYYRLKVETDANNYLVSNPIFVRFGEAPAGQVASFPSSGVEEPKMTQPVAPKVRAPENPAVPSVSPPKPVSGSPPPSTAMPSEPERPRVSPPTFKSPTAPSVKGPTAPGPVEPSATGQYVVAKIDGVSLKNGPGPRFPEVGRLEKGDRLPLVRRTTVKFNGKPWLVVDAGGRRAYVWEGVVTTE